MVLYKNKNYITRSDAPDTDFMGDADYVVPDDSELAMKIISMFPNFTIVEDDEGNIIDITEYIPEITPEEIEAHKVERIQESKVQLAKWLESNPMQFTDGKYYSVTEEKQALLNGNLASYERSIDAGINYPLKWNSTGDECVEWSYEDLRLLSLSIAGYVAPKVSIQQNYEIRLRACNTMDEIDAIEFNYD